MTKTSPLQAVRGMNDILPSQTFLWQKVEKVFREIFNLYGYQEIKLPLLEKTALFQRSIGEVTDIVEKEMYTFPDRNGENLTLRPEGTAGCVRAAIQHGMLYHQTQKLWYMGPMFRYERPQKGRYRQFYQIGVESFGFSNYLIEAELILMLNRCFEELNLNSKLTLQLNSLGSAQARLNYTEKFVQYCQQHVDQLDPDSQRRLNTNPLRILDSKNPGTKALLEHAPKLIDYLDVDSKKSFNQLCVLLNQCDIKFEINPYLVRGLDYYTGTVFEWVTPHLGAQSAVGAGGRYDGLTELLGGEPAPAVGFAMGIERLIELCTENFSPENSDIFIICPEEFYPEGFKIAEMLRREIRAIKIIFNYAAGSFKSQFKQADKSGALFALILGQDELSQNMITFKHLRQDSPQVSIKLPDLVQYIQQARGVE